MAVYTDSTGFVYLRIRRGDIAFRSLLLFWSLGGTYRLVRAFRGEFPFADNPWEVVIVYF